MTFGDIKSAAWGAIKRQVASSPRLRAWMQHALSDHEPFFAPGHFYSPVVDRDEVAARSDALWPGSPRAPVGIDFDPAGHARFIEEAVRPSLPGFDYFDPAKSTDGRLAFPAHNDQFTGMDALVLYAMMRYLSPARIVEVGSGFSTLLMRDVNRRYLGGSARIECIEPYPRDFLRDPGIDVALHVQPVQEMPPEWFSKLESGDILFIDSSHVCKTGSDVNHLFLDVLPRLADGVVVHVHDIFLPQEYPRDWVLGERRSWNEQYLLHALLAGSSDYRVLYAVHYANLHLARQLDGCLEAARLPVRDGSSFWFRKLRVHRKDGATTLDQTDLVVGPQ